MTIKKIDTPNAESLMCLIAQTDENGDLLYFNTSFKKALGYSDKELLGKSFEKFIFPADLWLIKYNKILADRGKLTSPFNFRIQRKSGEYFWIESLISFSAGYGNIYTFEGYDITSKLAGEKEDKNYLKNFEILSKAAATFVELPVDENLYVHISGVLSDLIKDSFISISSYREKDKKLITETFHVAGEFLSKAADLIGGSPIGRAYPLDDERKNVLLTRSLAKVEGGLHELALGTIPKPICDTLTLLFNIGDIYVIGLTKNGKLFGNAIIILRKGRSLDFPDVITAFINLASSALERKDAEERLKNSLKEKELLLKEIHHRVKNNMQVISSLLSLQSGYAAVDQDMALFVESRNRVKSMALVHDILYRSKDLSGIDFSEYVKSLSQMLFDTYNTNKGISLKLEINDIYISVDAAVPLGLILNELITNSIKYAFPNKENGEIYISLSKDVKGKYLLKVSDNGIGIPDGMNTDKMDTLGMTLIYNLAKQINGSVTLNKKKGTEFIICFEADSI